MYAVGALGKPMPHRPEAEGAVRPENSMVVGFPDAGVGPGGNPDWNPHTKNGLPWSVGNRGSPLCDSLESGKPYLLRTFFIRSEEALASANWPKPGSMEARLALMIWLKVSFFMMFPFGRPPVFLLLSSSASCGASLLVVFLSLYLLLFFCCAFTIGRKVCVRHAAIAISIVDSSVHLKERIKKRSYILLRSLPKRRFEQKSQRFSVDFNAGSPVCVVSSRRSAARLPVSTRTADFASF